MNMKNVAVCLLAFFVAFLVAQHKKDTARSVSPAVFLMDTVQVSPSHEHPNVRTMRIAERLEADRWTCTGPGCVEDMTHVARAIVHQSDSVGIEASLLVGVLMVENPWLDSTAVSHAGARGLFQVMPVWRGEYPECGDLDSVHGNVCYGARILDHYLDSEPDTDRALLAYNGCEPEWVSCNRYPSDVLGRAD